MKKTLLLLLLLAFFAVSGSAQIVGRRESAPVVREFANAADEINYYLTEAGYYKTDGCVVSPDPAQIERVRALARDNKELFLTAAFNRLKIAPADKMGNLLLALVYAGSEDVRPLTELLTPQNMKTVFAAKSSSMLEQLNNYSDYSADYAQQSYIIEAFVALKYRAAAPKILRMLNEEGNPNHAQLMQALVELDATESLVEFLQLRILEDLCNKNRYAVSYGTPVKNLLETLETLSKQADLTGSRKFERIRQSLILEPDEATLISFANQAVNERLRGTSILLLAASKSDAGVKVILEHLKNDPSSLVRFWSAQCFQTHQNPKEEVFDALIEAFHTDANPEVRWASLAALGQMDGKRFVPVIKEGLDDKNQMVRETAQRILEYIEKYGGDN